MPTYRLPTLHIIANSIPQAHYRAIKAVWNEGAAMRTQYDRKDDAGNYIDPPSRDARVLIEVVDPFIQPRYSPLSFCEIGTYIAEIMGAKDHRVIPTSILRRMINGDELTAEQKQYVHLWPYTYHQRLTNHPELDGHSLVDQIDLAIDSVVANPYTRRAMCTTSVPNLDPYLTEDIPCLREVQFRCVEDEDGSLVLNVSTTWRSRDLYKAWSDNVIGLTVWFNRIAEIISAKAGRPCRLGSYADYSMSLHIYGQDFTAVGGSAEKGLQGFFETFPTEDYYIGRSLDSEYAKEMLVLPQLSKLITADSIKQWQFSSDTTDFIKSLSNGIRKDLVKV